jgi:hypothetical protein
MMLRRLVVSAAVVVGAFLALLSSLDAAFVGADRQFLAIHPPSWVLGAPSNAATLDFDFANNRFWQAPPSYGQNLSSLLTVSRASTEYQANSAGLLHLFPAGTATSTNIGTAVWQSATNEALWSRDLTQTAWVKANIAAAHTATGADGAANSGSLLTAGAANGTVLQTFTIASQAQNLSVYVQRVTGSGEIDITENNGTTWTPLTSSNCYQPGTFAASGIVTTGYVRCSVEATVLNPIIGFRIVTNGDAINVDLVQLQTGLFPTPPCQSSGSTCATSADALGLVTPFPVGPFSAYFAGTPGAPISYATNQKFFSSTGSVDLGARRMASTGTVATISGALTGAAWSQNTAGKVAYALANGSQALVFNGGSAVTGSTGIAALAGGYSTTISIGSAAGTSVFCDCIISRVALWQMTKQPTAFLQQVTH